MPEPRITFVLVSDNSGETPAGATRFQDDWPGAFDRRRPHRLRAHIGTQTPGYGYESGDPYAAFLPPAVPVPENDGAALRAVVIIMEGAENVGQRYTGSLLLLTGQEYATLTFADAAALGNHSLLESAPRCAGKKVFVPRADVFA